MLITPTPQGPDSDVTTKLAGTLWTHAITDVGASEHGEQLANHYVFQGDNVLIGGFTPRWHDCPVCLAHPVGNPYYNIDNPSGGAPPPPPSPPYIVWRPQAVSGGDVQRFGAGHGEATVVAQVTATNLGVLTTPAYAGLTGEPCGGQDMTPRLGVALATRLTDTTLTWANAVEPIRAMGQGSTFPMAVALSSTGENVVDTVSTDGTRLLANEDVGGGVIPPINRVGSPHTPGYTPVLTSARHGIFILGAVDPVTGPVGEIWFSPIESETWSRVPTDYTPQYVLAATYSFASDELIFLEERRDPATSACRATVLDASSANGWNATTSFDPPMQFAIPSAVNVVAGTPNLATLTIAVDDGPAIHCLYHPVGATLALVSCDHGSHAGNLVDAVGATLSLTPGGPPGPPGHGHHADSVEVSVSLSETAPCAGPSGVANLVAIDFMSGHTTVLGTWPRHAAIWDRHAMTIDVDGSVLLAASSTAGAEHTIARIDVRQNHAISILDNDDAVLALPVVADAGGYTLVTLRPSDSSFATARIESFGGHHDCSQLTVGDEL